MLFWKVAVVPCVSEKAWKSYIKRINNLYNTEPEIGCLSSNNFYLPENHVYPNPSGIEVVQD